MKFPDKFDVLAVHARLISETGGSAGLRDEGLLESALAAAENRHYYEAADLVNLRRHLCISPNPGARMHRWQQTNSRRDHRNISGN